jgi:hypothetical protein
MGPLKSYSCRSSERTIKKFSNLVKSKTKTGPNSSNVLNKQANYKRVNIRNLQDELFRPSTYDASTFMAHPSGDCSFPQLWEPFRNETLIGDDNELICSGIRRVKVVKALKSYYGRLANVAWTEISLSTDQIRTAAIAWRDSVVYSSVMHRNLKKLTTRAGNIVLFESQRNSRR